MVNIFLVYQIDIDLRTIITHKALFVVALNGEGFFLDALAIVGNLALKESLPLAIRELDTVQNLQLMAQIGYQLRFVMDGQIFIPLSLQTINEVLF